MNSVGSTWRPLALFFVMFLANELQGLGSRAPGVVPAQFLSAVPATAGTRGTPQPSSSQSSGPASDVLTDTSDTHGRPFPGLLVRFSKQAWASGDVLILAKQTLALDGKSADEWSVRRTLVFPPVGQALADQLSLLGWVSITPPAATDLESLSARFEALPGVELVEVDSIGEAHGSCLPTDPLVPQQWWAINTGQAVQGQVGFAESDAGVGGAWCVTTGVPEVVIAVLDTGVSLSHPDLQTNLRPGYNFFNNNTNTDDNQSLSHGTFCSGIALGRAFNGQGISGVAPSCALLPVKVLSGSFGSETSTGNGVIWAADRGASVISMSLGFTQGSTFFRDAVLYAAERDVVMVASTGNTPGALVGFPARWNSVIAVGATDNRDNAAVFETTGMEMDLCAPGVNILTTTDTFGIVNGYGLQSGTSMAAPMVAGAAALVRSVRPTLTAPQVREILRSTSHDLGPIGDDPVFGAGRLDTAKAVLRAVNFGREQSPDFNQDGIVDLLDLLGVLDAWIVGAFDFNLDGRSDLLDLLEFLAVWLV